MVESMSIGEVARWAGVRPSTLRYYEGVGLLPPPERANGRRRYDGEVLREVLDRLAVVRVAQQAGFTISEIRTLLDGFSEDTPPSELWRALAREKLTEVDALIERAIGMKNLLERGLRCECLSLEECSLVGGLEECSVVGDETPNGRSLPGTLLVQFRTRAGPPS